MEAKERERLMKKQIALQEDLGKQTSYGNKMMFKKLQKYHRYGNNHQSLLKILNNTHQLKLEIQSQSKKQKPTPQAKPESRERTFDDKVNDLVKFKANQIGETYDSHDDSQDLHRHSDCEGHVSGSKRFQVKGQEEYISNSLNIAQGLVNYSEWKCQM